jgi:hypothetical protein
MSQLLRRLWADDHGVIIGTELLFILTTLVVGTVSALVALRQAVLNEATETARAIMALNPSYSFSGQSVAGASTAGSAAIDGTSTPLTEGSRAPLSHAALRQAPCD